MRQTESLSITITNYTRRQLEFLQKELQENRSKIVARAVDSMYEKIKNEVKKNETK